MPTPLPLDPAIEAALHRRRTQSERQQRHWLAAIERRLARAELREPAP